MIPSYLIMLININMSTEMRKLMEAINEMGVEAYINLYTLDGNEMSFDEYSAMSIKLEFMVDFYIEELELDSYFHWNPIWPDQWKDDTLYMYLFLYVDLAESHYSVAGYSIANFDKKLVRLYAGNPGTYDEDEVESRIKHDYLEYL